MPHGGVTPDQEIFLPSPNVVERFPWATEENRDEMSAIIVDQTESSAMRGIERRRVIAKASGEKEARSSSIWGARRRWNSDLLARWELCAPEMG